jgi:hypothetical protein
VLRIVLRFFFPLLKIDSYATESFLFKSNAKLKKALANGPLLATMQVYEDFIYYKSGVYEHTDGKQLGGHAVTIDGIRRQTRRLPGEKQLGRGLG